KAGCAYTGARGPGARCAGLAGGAVPRGRARAPAATQPFPRGDAVVPQFVAIAPEGYELVNDGRIFTPFVGAEPVISTPGIWGGANWPPSSYDPVQQTLFVCASSVVGQYTGGGDAHFAAPEQGQRYLGGVTGVTRLPRMG